MSHHEYASVYIHAWESDAPLNGGISVATNSGIMSQLNIQYFPFLNYCSVSIISFIPK
jgi:hypothetical protein